jgi:SAM-dependent methyltransferase
VSATATYALGRTPEEHDRLRAQARVWEGATSRLLDAIGLRRGARCLDAGCGPGETMRLMAERVGAVGRVHGIDVDAWLGAITVEQLHATGHHQCSFEAHDVAADLPIPGAPFDLVYARLLLYHLPDRLAVLGRLWDAVAPGGNLVIQDYDLRGISVLPALDSVDDVVRVLIEAFAAVGCDVHIGVRLPQLFAEVGIGEPDGTDVAGRLEPLATGRAILDRTLRSVLPTAVAHGVVSESEGAEILAALDRDAERFPDRPIMWPLMVGAWKAKAGRLTRPPFRRASRTTRALPVQARPDAERAASPRASGGQA